MALRQLVEGDCGAANPLVQWSSHFHQQKPLSQGGVGHDRLQEIAVSPQVHHLLASVCLCIYLQRPRVVGQLGEEVMNQDMVKSNLVVLLFSLVLNDAML